MVETGQFAMLWKKMAEQLGLEPEFIKTDWRIGADPAAIEARLAEDKNKEIKAVCVLHNETATGCLSPIAEIRKAINAAGHPALFLVDTISSLASTDYRHDEWGVDVTVGGAQKGLMLPPGMSFNAVSDKALAASKTSKLPKSFFAWDDMLNMNKVGFFPYTPATQMLQGLAVAIDMLHEEGLDNVFARHDRLAEATRRAIARLGPRDHLPRPEILFADHHRGADAGGPRRRRVPRARARALQHFLWRELRPVRRQDVPHRPSRRHQRRDACWARSPPPKWRSRSPASRTRRAACRRRWTTSSPRMAAGTAAGGVEYCNLSSPAKAGDPVLRSLSRPHAEERS